MAKAKIEKEVLVEEAPVEEVVEDNGFVEVEFAHSGSTNMTFYGDGFRAEFVNGKATVSKEVADKLKEANLIK